MKKSIRFMLTAVLVAFFGIANAQNTQWFGYARTCFNGEDWQNKFITFNTQNPAGVSLAPNSPLPQGQAFSIYDMTGRLVFQGCYSGQRCFEGLKPGIYVVNIAGRSLKVMIE